MTPMNAKHVVVVESILKAWRLHEGDRQTISEILAFLKCHLDTPPTKSGKGRDLVDAVLDEARIPTHEAEAGPPIYCALLNYIAELESRHLDTPGVPKDGISVSRRELTALLLSAAMLARNDAGAAKVYAALKADADRWLSRGTP